MCNIIRIVISNPYENGIGDHPSILEQYIIQVFSYSWLDIPLYLHMFNTHSHENITLDLPLLVWLYIWVNQNMSLQSEKFDRFGIVSHSIYRAWKKKSCTTWEPGMVESLEIMGCLPSGNLT